MYLLELAMHARLQAIIGFGRAILPDTPLIKMG
jgi:hypothetical protein